MQDGDKREVLSCKVISTVALCTTHQHAVAETVSDSGQVDAERLQGSPLIELVLQGGAVMVHGMQFVCNSVL